LAWDSISDAPNAAAIAERRSIKKIPDLMLGRRVLPAELQAPRSLAGL
jgi:hypothetical protein